MRRNSKTILALTFCLVTAASHRFDLLMWKKEVRAMLVTGERTWRNGSSKSRRRTTSMSNRSNRSKSKRVSKRVSRSSKSSRRSFTCCLAWMTLTLKASTAFLPMSSR